MKMTYRDSGDDPDNLISSCSVQIQKKSVRYNISYIQMEATHTSILVSSFHLALYSQTGNWDIPMKLLCHLQELPGACEV